MLKTMHSEGGWLGGGDDQAGEVATSLGEEQLAKAMAYGGGLGLSAMLVKSLRSGAEAQAKTAAQAASVQSSNSPSS
jgi:Rod binding domain-containing protein